MSIPLPVCNVQDTWVWHYTNNGLYSVQYGYRLAQSLLLPTQSKYGPTTFDNRLWAMIWGSPIQPKLKFFTWKIFHNILPLQETLAGRNINIVATCQVCGLEDESLHHIFTHCSVATQLAHLTGCESFIAPTHPVVLWRRINATNPLLSCKLIYFWWRLWKARNVVVFEAYQIAIPILARQFSRHWKEAEAFLTKPSLQQHPPSNGTLAIYTPSNPDWTFSVDAAVKTSSSQPYGSLGLVITDAGGIMREGMGFVQPHLSDPLTLELLAIRYALLHISSRRNHYPGTILLRTDCAEAARMLRSSTLDIRGGAILQDCYHLFHSQFSVFLTHVSRQNNSAAHLVAREALYYSDKVLTSLDLRYCIPM
ncbi:hypothetical protein LINGRAHAP2_LOCUS14484 [Linum grandiflorum]